MREIKYRALAKVTYNYETHNSRYKIKEGDWVFGYYYRDVLDNEDSCSYFHVNYIRIEYGDHYGDIEVDGETVGQFTGMLDKYGMPIFEGDIIQWYGFNLEVKFIVDGWFAETADESITEAGQEWESSCSVLGNIHQHVHLLENK